MSTVYPFTVLAVVALAAAPAIADTPTAQPATVQNVLDCRAIADPQARLACFDGSVAALAAASDKGDVRVVDREQVKQSRRALFGFSLPSLAIFGGHKSGDPRKDAQDDEIKEITSKITAVTHGAYGIWILTLAEGGRWEQTDSVTLGRSPKVGASATVKRGAIGSYKMNIDGGQYIKVRRIG